MRRDMRGECPSLWVAASMLCAVSSASPVLAQRAAYPDRPIRFIVPFGPGGPGDILARVIGKRLADSLGQPVVIDNRSGASTIIGTELAAKSPPDGHTLLLISTTHAVNPSLFDKLPYDPVRDFAPVTLVASTPFMLVVHPAVPAQSVTELVALAKKKPRSVNYGSSGNGSSIHLTTELFSLAAGVELTHVPYKGSGPAFVDLIGGHIQMLFSSTVSSLPYVTSGKVRALAITSLKRAASLPSVATVAEAGYAGFEASSWFGILVPAKTPSAVINRLLSDTRAAIQSAEVNDWLISQGAEPGGNSPAEFGAFFQAELGKWAKVAAAAKIQDR